MLNTQVSIKLQVILKDVLGICVFLLRSHLFVVILDTSHF